MREIKFRAWNGEKFQYFGIGTFWHNTDISVYHGLVLDGVKFEQFTGLHDKTGKEIYEGDIIDCDMTWVDRVLPHRGAIVYCDNFCSFATENYSGKTLLSKLRAWTIEVIGNIHENANLLENK